MHVINFRNEAEHDRLLIDLARELSHSGRVDILEAAFGVSGLGPLQRTKHQRRPFDVELTFSGASLVIETKVDSDEDGRWNRSWQTENIYTSAQHLTHLRLTKHFFFLTYGTAEFYGKPYMNGAASSHFAHLGLDRIVALVSAALQVSLPSAARFRSWLLAMQVEQEKRRNAATLVHTFSQFRREYLRIHRDVDFPRNRLLFLAPEIAFPVLHQLATLWNADPDLHGSRGRVSLYPVERRCPQIHDSILNFLELWEGGMAPVGSTLVQVGEKFYFEINEDLNLNLKLDAAALRPALRSAVHSRLVAVSWPSGTTGQPRDYKQQTFVLFEWDFGLWEHASNIQAVANVLRTVLDLAMQALA
jgi:hypothetical protein